MDIKMSDEVLATIKAKASEFNFDWRLVAAIVFVESNGCQWASRFEPNWKWFMPPFLWSYRLGITEKTEHVHQQTSWGLMQVIGSVARELGHQGHLTELCDPDVGLHYGCKKLSTLMRNYSLDQAISAYNAGTPRRRADGSFVNQEYVDKVFRAYDILMKKGVNT